MWTSAHCIDGFLVKSWCYHSPPWMIWYPWTHWAEQNCMFQSLIDSRGPREQGRQTQSCSRVESAYSLYCTFLFGFALTTSWHDVYAVQKTHCLVVLPFTLWKPEITTYTRLLSIQVHILYFFIYFSFSFLSSVTMPATCFKIFILANYK